MAKKLSELTAVTTLADADVMYAAQSPFGAMDSKKITVGNLKTVFGGGGGGSSTIVQAMIDPQVNISSQGVTTTDTVGNTFQEPAGQTRMTLPASRTVSCGTRLSGHVSAGTGTFELYNVTDATSLGMITTTATTETILTVLNVTTFASFKGDQLTIRVKNSGAGNTTTIDCGGMYSSDTTLNPFTSASLGNVLGSCVGGYPSSIKLAVLKGSTTSTFTIQPAQFVGGNGNPATTLNLGSAITEAAHGTVVTLTPSYRIFGSGVVGVTATAVFGTCCVFMSFEVKADAI